MQRVVRVDDGARLGAHAAPKAQPNVGMQQRAGGGTGYEVDDDEVPTVLRLEEYGVDEECGWVLLEAVPAEREGGGEEVAEATAE